ncbi:hypothetical protein OE749_15405 [Aestuariibacter sp. AA17]|uniref:Uncharacterized protein n=1 Tax=Fluctibacter corallii TaxID=2984329 RepID=A0ABT3ABM4_9ALTE|nr:hypothetical protein [Aestuariibacter sp. AA17]MCV2886080.1 hypothetical protein [Aestuariibacter sp. AA17]
MKKYKQAIVPLIGLTLLLSTESLANGGNKQVPPDDQQGSQSKAPPTDFLKKLEELLNPTGSN